MSVPSSEERRARAALEAAMWSQRLASKPLSEHEQGEFVDWLRESPLHVAEMLRMEKLTADLTQFDQWQSFPPDETHDQQTVVSLDDRRVVGVEPARRPSPRALRIGGAIAALLMIVVSVMFIGQYYSMTAIHAAAGERREITLDDGSIVRLAPGTDIRVRLRSHLRSVIVDRGKATFTVAKDASRPFVVDAAKTRVEAVGTIFSVASAAGTVVVTVAEGIVKVTPKDSAGATFASTPRTTVPLRARERMTVSGQGVASAVRRVDTAPTLEWDDAQMEVENARVIDVVARFNSLNRIQVRIVDDALGSQLVSGVFDENDPKSFVDFLQAIAGAEATYPTSTEIAVTSGAPGSGPIAPNH